jgi:uncharacterized RmlC-like cupin family protein
MSDPSENACRIMRAADAYTGKQGLTYFCGIAAETVSSRGVSMHLDPKHLLAGNCRPA